MTPRKKIAYVQAAWHTDITDRLVSDLLGIDLLGAAMVLGTMATKAVKGENVGKMFVTDPQPTEYQLYLEAKREREAKEAEKAAKAKNEMGIVLARRLSNAEYDYTVRDLTGAERDRIYAEQARRYPGFAEYARQTAGVRTIPVLELRRA